MYKKEILDYLNKIDKLMNKDILCKDKTRERIHKAYNMEKVDHVPIIEKTTETIYPRHEIFQDKEKNILQQLHNYYLTLQHKTDFLPFIHPFQGVIIHAAFFGGKVIYPRNNDPWIKPVLSNPKDIMDLKKPDIKNSPFFDLVIDMIKLVKKNLGNYFPIGITDPQGPLDIASLLFNTEDFIMACITNKKEIHYLLDMITDIFIEFNKIQIDIIGKDNLACPGSFWPLGIKNTGIPVSDDMAVLFSPNLFKEFGIPYLSKISEEFNGLYYHSCGNYLHNLENILSIPKIRAINGHTSPNEMEPIKTKKIIRNRCVYWTGYSHENIGWDKIHTEEECLDIYDNYYLRNVIGNGKSIIIVGLGGYLGYGTSHYETASTVHLRFLKHNPSVEEKDNYYDQIVETSNKIIKENKKSEINEKKTD